MKLKWFKSILVVLAITTVFFSDTSASTENQPIISTSTMQLHSHGAGS
jgi:hypothetical protein